MKCDRVMSYRTDKSRYCCSGSVPSPVWSRQKKMRCEVPFLASSQIEAKVDSISETVCRVLF